MEKIIKFDKFNENKKTNRELSVDEIDGIKNNINRSVIKGEQKLIIDGTCCVVKWNDKEVSVYHTYTNGWELGYAVEVDGDIKYLISIYEPYGCSIKQINRDLITFYGHEEIISLWLDNGDINVIQTR